MTISSVNYRETIFKHPDLTKITSVSTYETLNLPHNKIEANAMAVYSNIGGGKHSYLGLVVSTTVYSLLTNPPFVCQFYLVNLSIHIATTRHAQENWYANTTKTYKFPQDKRIGTSDHPENRLGCRRKIFHSHEEQDHWPIHRHPLNAHPVFDFHVRENLSKPTAWPRTEHQVNAVWHTGPDWNIIQPSRRSPRVRGTG